MATRAIYTFKDEDTTIHVYKHWDGYPEAALKFIEKAIAMAWALPRFEADEFAASFVAANKEQAGDIRLMNCIEVPDMGQEFQYIVTCTNGKIWVSWEGVYGPLDELIAKYCKEEVA